MVAWPTHIPVRCWAQHLRPDSTVWPVHTYCVWPCQARQKYSCTVRSIGGLGQVLILLSGFPRKSALRSIANYARSMGAHIPHTTLVIVVGLRRTERRNPVSAPPRKAGIRVIPVNQNFAQLINKIEKLEKALKKSGKKGQKHCYKDSNSDSE